MIESVAEFEKLLNDLNPTADEFVLQADDLIARLSPKISADVFLAVFTFFENHPDCDCGAPVTLVHHVEDFYPSYVDRLLESARAAPSYNSALMINRILNSEIPAALRAEMLEILDAIAAADALPGIVRDLAAGFIRHQSLRDN